MSGFITNPPAAMTTDFALIAPTFGELLPRHAGHRDARLVDDELGGAGLVADLHAEARGPLEQQIDHHAGAAGVAGHRHLVAARSRHRLLQERPHLLVAGEHQALGVGLDHRLAREIAALELKTQVFEPIEMLDAAVAVRTNLGVVRLPRHRDRGTCTSPRASPGDRSPAGRRSRHRGKSGLRQAKWCLPPRRRARAPAPARRPRPR